MENFYLFILMCIFFVILPGPDIAIITKNTVTVGKAGGVRTVMGACCALLIHTTAAVLGLSAIIMKSALLFSVLKYVGAVYLLYLGIKTLWSIKNKGSASSVETHAKSRIKSESSFKQGFLTDLLNPKVALLFLTFFPQFVDHGSSSVLPFILMGLTYTMITALWCFFYVLLINRISAFMKNPKTQSIIEGITGTILIGFGIRLFLEKAHN
ncbi:LysE family translocator [Bacillus sp. B-jedd]|uniref:LysE family translocator n=1 Tax=Bacillus sp. B-jedd TaxID=1476857 RepID=UPI00051571EC|nr:LysE family translocator [Bacillus sp. B-jedd]CEG27184.1 homoserine/threonine efflux protein [Bacillus sp. B-jedd]